VGCFDLGGFQLRSLKPWQPTEFVPSNLLNKADFEGGSSSRGLCLWNQ